MLVVDIPTQILLTLLTLIATNFTKSINLLWMTTLAKSGTLNASISELIPKKIV